MDSVEIKSVDREKIRGRVDQYASWLLRTRPEIEEIVIFGSFADDTYVPGSDLDVFLVLTESDKAVWDRVPDYLPGSFPVGLDIFPYTRSEIERLRPCALLDAVDASGWRYTRN